MTKEIEIAADIVSAYVSNNSLPHSELCTFIQAVHGALLGLGNVRSAVPSAIEKKRQPAISVKQSITDNFLICLEDGKKFKSMKRHLSKLGITPDEYRAKWGLPPDYPMVAPTYAAERSTLAKAIGLGLRPGTIKRAK